MIKFIGSGSSLVMLELVSDDHVSKYAAIFWWENMKNYSLLLAEWNILSIYHL